MINIGAGDWTCENWINLDYSSKWYAKANKKHKYIEYDIRNDDVPFDDKTVDVIYCSHVIEHIENKFIEKAFKECYRVLKKGGVMRIACPDAEFLYNVTRYNTDYWNWKKDWSKKMCVNQESMRDIDYLVSQIATPKMLYYIHSINDIDYYDNFKTLEMYDFFDDLTGDLKYRENFPGDHINYWTFEKLRKLLAAVGFAGVIRSKWSASCSKEMASTIKFDTTVPIMSLYADAIK